MPVAADFVPVPVLAAVPALAAPVVAGLAVAGLGAGVGAVCATATVAARAISRAECLAKFIDVLETPK